MTNQTPKPQSPARQASLRNLANAWEWQAQQSRTRQLQAMQAKAAGIRIADR